MRPRLAAAVIVSLCWSPARAGGSAGAVAVSPDGRLAAAVNPDSGSVTLVDAKTLALIKEIPVGRDPRTLAFSGDSRTLLVADRGSGELSVVDVGARRESARLKAGVMPYGVVVSSGRAYVSDFGGAAVLAFDAASGRPAGRAAVGGFPAGLAATRNKDGSTELLVTDFYTGKLTVLDPASLRPAGSAAGAPGSDLAQFVAVSPDGSRAYVPATRANSDNMLRAFDTTVFPIVDVFALPGPVLLPRERVGLGASTRPVDLPFAVAVSTDGRLLYVAAAGSDEVLAIDAASQREVAHADVGANPRGLALSADGARLFVDDALGGALTVLDAPSLKVLKTVALTRILLAPEQLLGKKVFNTSRDAALSMGRWMSCANCHLDGGTDGRTWKGFPDGPRNTPALFGVGQTAPYHWSGDLDDLQDVEVTVRGIQFGRGLAPGPLHDSLIPYAGASKRLDALAAYLRSIVAFPAPPPADDAAVRRGRELFEKQGCAVCHPAPLYTDRKLHDVGTGDLVLEHDSHGRGTRFDTPSLRELWLTAPYFHDGSAPTLEAALSRGAPHDAASRLTPGEFTDLVSFLRSLPQGGERSAATGTDQAYHHD